MMANTVIRSEGNILHPSVESGQRNYNTIIANSGGSSTSDIMSAQVLNPDRRRCSCYRQRGSFVDHIVYFCALAVASYVGVVIRIYLSKTARWNGVPLFPSLSAELVGTAIMGFIGSHKKLLADRHKPLYQAIATGLCGSITTFSSWNSEAVETLLQVGQDPPDNITRIAGWVMTLILGVGMPVGALLFGRHLAHLSPWSDMRLQRESTEEGHSPVSKFCIILENISFTFAWIVFTCLVIVLPYYFKRLDILFSIIFASFGTYVRWHLAPLNSTFTGFKLGTFIVNVGGSWVLGGTIVAKTHLSEQLGAEHPGVLVLSGVATGFCGCLTTVSTFAVELTSLSLIGSYAYALSSILLAQLGLIIIRGTFEWTR